MVSTSAKSHCGIIILFQESQIRFAIGFHLPKQYTLVHDEQQILARMIHGLAKGANGRFPAYLG